MSVTIHPCVEILTASRGHNLKYIPHHEYSWKYRQRIWEELRPLKLLRINYGSSDRFIIRRCRIDRSELAMLSRALEVIILKKYDV